MRSSDEIMQYIAEIEHNYFCANGYVDEGEQGECCALRWALDKHCDEDLIKTKIKAYIKEQGL